MKNLTIETRAVFTRAEIINAICMLPGEERLQYAIDILNTLREEETSKITKKNKRIINAFLRLQAKRFK